MRSRRRRRATEPPVSFFSFQDVITSVTGIVLLVTLLLSLELSTRAPITAAAPAAAAELERAAAADVATADALEQKRVEANERAKVLRHQVDDIRGELEVAAVASPLLREEDLGALAAEVTSLRVRIGRTRKDLAHAEAVRNAAVGALTRERSAQNAAEHDAVEARRRLEAARHSKRLVVLPGRGDAKRPLVVECAEGGLTVGSLAENGELSQLASWGGDAVGQLLAWAGARDPAGEYFLIMVRPDAVTASDRLIERLRRSGFDVGWEPLPVGDELFQPDTE